MAPPSEAVTGAHARTAATAQWTVVSDALVVDQALHGDPGGPGQVVIAAAGGDQRCGSPVLEPEGSRDRFRGRSLSSRCLWGRLTAQVR